MLLTAAKLIRLISTVIIIITGVGIRDALSITAFILFICAGAMCWALTWSQKNKVPSKTELT